MIEIDLLTEGILTVMLVGIFHQKTETSGMTLVLMMQTIDHKEDHLDFMMVLHMGVILVLEIDLLDPEMDQDLETGQD